MAICLLLNFAYKQKPSVLVAVGFSQSKFFLFGCHHELLLPLFVTASEVFLCGKDCQANHFKLPMCI